MIRLAHGAIRNVNIIRLTECCIDLLRRRAGGDIVSTIALVSICLHCEE